jgi:DNA-binding NtrC family response regulator
MRTGPEFSNDVNAAGLAASRSDAVVRILFVADRARLAHAIQSAFEKSLPGPFHLEVEPLLDQAALRIHHERFDLLLLDLALAGTRRSVLMDRASELATRLPVVALSGTESLGVAGSGGTHGSHRDPLEEADLAAVVHRTLRRARRLGTFALTPVFCRLERFGA